MIYAIVCTQGEMSYQDIVKECGAEKWVPLLVMRIEGEAPIVPLFEDIKTAHQFAKRNVPRNWLCGVVNISLEDANIMDRNGWKSILYTFPRKLKDVVDFDIEVLEYNPDKELSVQAANLAVAR